MKNLGKKVFIMVLGVVLAVALLPLLTRTTKADPEVIEIDSAEDLLAFAERVNNGETTLCARLVSDIEFDDDAEWVPIGESQNKYMGIFDGNGHKLINLRIKIDYCDSGLFGYIGESGVVKGLTLESGFLEFVSAVSDESIGAYYVGCIAGKNEGTIKDCNTSCNVSGECNTGKTYFLGGIAGQNNGEISNCKNGGRLRALGQNFYVAGIASKNPNKIQYCCNTGELYGNSQYINIGGVAFYNDGMIEECSNTGEISADCDSAKVGGVTAENRGTVKGSFNTGDIRIRFRDDSVSATIGGIAMYQ